MAKRYTETNVWVEDWFITMPIEYSLFWFFIKDKCDHAGIWKPNKKIFEVMFEVNIDLNLAISYFNKDKQRIEVLSSGHWLIMDFFSFQYGSVFNPNNRVHESIKSLYDKENINLTSIRGLVEVKLRSNRPLIEVKDGVKDKDKESINSLKEFNNTENLSRGIVKGEKKKTSFFVLDELLFETEYPELCEAENFLGTFKSFLAFRAELKKPMTPTAVKNLMSKLGKFKEAGDDICECLLSSIEHNWQGVFPTLVQKAKKAQSELWEGTII